MRFKINSIRAAGTILFTTATAIAAALIPTTAQAQSALTRWAPNGPVNAVASLNGVVYMGGSFTRLGPPTGAFVQLDAASGAVLSPNPAVSGVVHALVSDGSGGYFIGGSFTSAQGQPRSNVAHLDASGNVTSWNPPTIGGVVLAMAIDPANPGVLYIAGPFSTVGGVARDGTAAFDASTGALASWNPGASGVSTMVAQNGVIYVGGNFTTCQGQPRNNLAALDINGSLLSWNPDVDGVVYCMVPFALPGTHALVFFIGGQFTSIGGQARYSIAELDATGSPLAWSPNADHAVKTIALSLGARGNLTSVYAGGTFDLIGAASRAGLAQLDPTSGVATSWDRRPTPRSTRSSSPAARSWWGASSRTLAVRRAIFSRGSTTRRAPRRAGTPIQIPT